MRVLIKICVLLVIILKMKLIFSVILLFIYLISAVLSELNNFRSLQIKDLEIIKCDDKHYPLSVNNVDIQIGTKPKIKVSGSLYSDIDLVKPIKASLSIKRDILGIWIPVPCENNIGSCTYDDLCNYGIPQNTTCPDIYNKNNVPCRCPIPKGNYTISPLIILSKKKKSSILSGKYKGTIEVTHNDLLLSCYNIYFVLYETYDINNVYSVIQV